MILLDKKLVKKVHGLYSGRLAKERIVILVLCDVSRERLDVLDAEVLGLNCRLDVACRILDRAVFLLVPFE